MAFNKKEVFSNDAQVLAKWSKALSHPARIAILQKLVQSNSCICGDLVEELPLAQSTVSQHLKALKEAGLIKGNVDGPRSCYCIDAEEFQHFEMAMKSFLNEFHTLETLKNCC